MADSRIRQPVKIVDPSTDANEAAVTASGDLQVTLASEVVATELPTAAALADDASNPTAPAVGAFGMVWDGATWDRLPGTSADGVTVNLGTNNDVTTTADATDGSAHGASQTGFRVMGTDSTNDQQIAVDADGHLQVDVLSGASGGTTDTDDDVIAGGQTTGLSIGLNYGWDGTQWERLSTDASGSLDVNVTSSVALDVSAATVTVDSELPTAAALADDASNPTVPAVGAFGMGYDSGNANWNRVEVDDAGHLQVDVLSGGGTATPSGPTTEALLASAVSAGGTGFLDSASITEAEKVWKIHVAATVPYKFRVGFQENSVRTAQTGWMFGQAGTVVQWEPSSPDFYVHAGASAGTDTIYVEYFNMDNSDTADIHATVEYAT